jgi:hypothetical protein
VFAAAIARAGAYPRAMRWLACFVLLAGCVRARATVVHPTDTERQAPEPSPASPDLWSVELGALVPFEAGARDPIHVHIAPGVRLFGSQPSAPLWGVAIGADVLRASRATGFAFEGAVYLGNGGNDPAAIEQAIDLFAGVAVHARRSVLTSSIDSAIAVGPSIGILGMPGGHAVVMYGLGIRATGARRSAGTPQDRRD